jgi:endonuclease-3
LAEDKEPFDIDVAMGAVGDAVRDLPKAALFALRDEGFTSVFEQVVACMLSVRTRDETTLRLARQLFAVARTPQAISEIGPARLDALIHASTFHEVKTRNILAIADIAARTYHGTLPCDDHLLRALPGVGPKCANLALGIACNEPRIGVDIHVHRVTNRWGYVLTTTPEATLTALEVLLPRRYWLEINQIVMPFGKFICTGPLPRCSTCPVLRLCPQVGVTAQR